MKGLYVYCLCPQGTEIKKIKTKGVQAGGSVSSLVFKDIEAVISKVDLTKFNQKELERQIRDEPKWLREKVESHHLVIVEINKIAPVIPMKFGTVFKTKKGLETELQKHHKEFVKLLSWLKDKQEWGIKVYLNGEELIKQLKGKDKKLQQLKRGRAKTSKGLEWYLDKKTNEIIQQKLDKEIDKYLNRIIEGLNQNVEKLVINNPLPKELTAKDKEMVLNSACLIKKAAIKPFQKSLKELFKKFDNSLEFELTGPWPPYNFVNLPRGG